MPVPAGAAFDLDRDFLRLVTTGRHVIHVGFIEVQVDGFAVESLATRFRVQAAQQFFRGLHFGGGAGDLEDVAAVGDLHAQAQFDLAQVCVKRATEVGQAFDVFGFQQEFAFVLGGHGSGQCLVWSGASSTRHWWKT